MIGELEYECSSGAIVFVMDLSLSNGLDAPIFLNIHDDSNPEILVADSFLSFLEKLESGQMSTLIEKIYGSRS